MPVLDEMIDIANSLNYGNTQELAQSIMEVSSGESNTYIDTHISIRENYYFGYNTNKVAIISISSERDYQAYKWIDELPSSSYIKDLISYTIQNHK